MGHSKGSGYSVWAITGDQVICYGPQQGIWLFAMSHPVFHFGPEQGIWFFGMGHSGGPIYSARSIAGTWVFLPWAIARDSLGGNSEGSGYSLWAIAGDMVILYGPWGSPFYLLWIIVGDLVSWYGP
jgi:hypothetical protein